uniref:DUF4408 domain-containing protein n=1 Tax=Cajanus cajan TaxID=3821 RepID=A0A151TYV1_CAJCA|nr:hypothetical protein KK1_004823 [Cajanus cajan]
MLQDSVSATPTFLATLYSWFTPTVFFLLLQLVIGTIFIISNLANSHKRHHPQHPHHHHHHNDLPRSPSILQRLKSINFYPSPHTPLNPYNTTHFPQSHQNENFQLPRSPSLLQRLKSINLYTYFPTEPPTNKLPPHGSGSSLDEIYSKLQQGQEGHFSRTHSDTKPASGEVPVKLPRKMKKSASSKSAFSHFKEEDIVETRRPATVRETGAAVDDHEVDAKADDFINRFKQQLKLQRLDSIMRYKEMIGRGSPK